MPVAVPEGFFTFLVGFAGLPAIPLPILIDLDPKSCILCFLAKNLSFSVSLSAVPPTVDSIQRVNTKKDLSFLQWMPGCVFGRQEVSLQKGGMLKCPSDEIGLTPSSRVSVQEGERTFFSQRLKTGQWI